MTKAEVDEVGRGHVWTGAQGKAHKLVDELGGLGAALEEAARRGRVAAGYELVELPAPPPSVLGVVGRLLGVEAGAGLTLADLPQVKALLGAAMPSVLVAPEVPQARLPFDVRWP
jgi:protease-4